MAPRAPAKKFVKRKGGAKLTKRSWAGKKKAFNKNRRLVRSSLGDSFGNMVRNPGNGSCSTSSFTHRKPASKQVRAIETVGAPNIGFQNKTLSVEVLSGQQGSEYADIMPVNQLRRIAQNVPTGSTSGRPPWRFVVQETLDTFHMTNGTGATLEVDLYDIFPKRNVPDNQTYVPPGQTATSANSYLLDGTPTGYWKQGARLSGSIAADAFTSYEEYNVYNASPMDSLLFKTFFRVAKRTRIFLPQGASHKHTVIRHINQLVNTAECVDGDGSLTYLTKCSSSLLIVVRGEPCDGVVPDTQFRTLTTSSGLLQIVQTARYKWTWVADQAQSNYYTNNLIGYTALQNINPATGAVTNVDQLSAT